MTERQYVIGLMRAYRSEVFGEAVYAMAARLTRHPDHRRKREALTQLETLMKIQLADALAVAGVTTRQRAARRWLGAAVGILAGLLPWRFTMTLLGVITRFSTPFFERLESQSAGRGGSHVDGLGAHERAQSEFVRRELAGDDEHSLHEVLVLLQLARAHPGRVAALVLSGTPAGILTLKVLGALQAIGAAAAQMDRVPAWNEPHPALAADVFERDPARGFLYAQLAALNPPGALARLALHEVMTDPGALADWSIPTLLVGGEHDRLFAPEVLEDVAAAIPGARFERLASAGHSPYFETPEEFNRVVEEFLAAHWG